MVALADPKATTVVYMAKRTFPALAKRLFAAGLPHDTPAMLAENISRPDQNLLRDTIQSLAEQLEQDVSSAPGLILYGSLADAP